MQPHSLRRNAPVIGLYSHLDGVNKKRRGMRPARFWLILIGLRTVVRINISSVVVYCFIGGVHPLYASSIGGGGGGSRVSPLQGPW